MKVATVSEMREMDRTAVERYGIAEDLLMENAALAAYQVIQDNLGVAGKRLAVFAGAGNNGGDGLAIARKIHSNGGRAQVFLLGDPGRFKGAARANLEILRRLQIPFRRIESTEGLDSKLAACQGIVDAIFGTGLARAVEGLFASVIDCINLSRKPVFSVDIPSGIHGDTGKVMGTAVRARHTITFGLPKPGNLLYPGFAHCGKLHVTHISFPPELTDAPHLKLAVNRPPIPAPRNPEGHKGRFGDVLFIAGASHYYGAPVFAALAFLKAGGGYARLAAPRAMTPFLSTGAREVVLVPQKETATGSLSMDNLDGLVALCRTVDMVVLGPGLSLDPETQQLARRLAAEVDKPLLVDGDGLSALAGDMEILRERQAETVLTPHLGEMARLTGLKVSEIDLNKVPVLQRAASQWQAVVLLKGPHSLVGYPDGRVFINLSGNSGMATAGSGDVLAGAIAAMYGLGLSLPDAARAGCHVHGMAGDLAAADKGQDGMTAQDILDKLPAAVKALRADVPHSGPDIPVVL